MKIRIKDNARDLYVATQALNAPVNYSWAAKLRALEGMTVDVETDYMFQDQYNTGPIPGVSDIGLRIMAQSVVEVIDDERPGAQRCQWCGRCSKVSDTCPWCAHDDHLQRFPV